MPNNDVQRPAVHAAVDFPPRRNPRRCFSRVFPIRVAVPDARGVLELLYLLHVIPRALAPPSRLQLSGSSGLFDVFMRRSRCQVLSVIVARRASPESAGFGRTSVKSVLPIPESRVFRLTLSFGARVSRTERGCVVGSWVRVPGQYAVASGLVTRGRVATESRRIDASQKTVGISR